MIEKDFWVCIALYQVFSDPELNKHMTFKGGTSLSKVHKLIDRFSEDCDISLDKEFLKVPDAQEIGISGKERTRRIDALKEAAYKTVSKQILPALRQKFSMLLNKGDKWDIELDEKDKQTILFSYPRTLSYGKGYGNGAYGAGEFGEGEFGYVKPIVRLEFGSRSGAEPHKLSTITPYVAEVFPQWSQGTPYKIATLSAERTIWEKIVILHALHHGMKPNERRARHYYDLYKMVSHDNLIKSALQQVILLDKIVETCITYFKDNKASYETAKIGTLAIVPKVLMIEDLKKDYNAMNEMFIGEPPEFEAILDSIISLEKRINSISVSAS